MISIIIPIYKVEKYLPRCIESLLAQTYKNLEIILIDDGSPDGCPQICDNYAQRDSRIIVIHQKNTGVSAARNAGLKIAKGEYIGFCDADDFVRPTMYEKLKKFIEYNEADLAICGYDYVDEDGAKSREYVNIGDGCIDQEECYLRFFDMPPTIRLGVCNKLYRHQMIQSLSFPFGIKGAEDALFLGTYIGRIKKAVKIDEPLYMNCERRGSATRGGLQSDVVVPALDIYQTIRRAAVELYPGVEKHAQAYYLDACLLNYGLHKDDLSLKRTIQKRIRKEIASMVANSEIFWKTRIMYLLFAFGVKK